MPRAPYLDDLNPAQRAAVEALDGPVLMLAGAGTGKTKALTARIAHLLTTGRAAAERDPGRDLHQQGRARDARPVGRMVGEAVEGMPWLGTFHAVREAPAAARGAGGAAVELHDPRHRRPGAAPEAAHPGGGDRREALARADDGAHHRRLEEPRGQPDNVPAADVSAFDHKGVDLYAAYQARLRDLNAVDFGDLLLHMITIFRTHDDVLEQYQRWFRYILVDEYQDTNIAQYMWLRLLARRTRTSAAWGTTTSRSMAGAGPRWATSCASKPIFRARR
jgi:DNA helicase-2/ATP-dependent DNA helicase PcrA